jgi:hypothetical protein
MGPVAAPQVGVIGFGIDGLKLHEQTAFLGSQLDADLLRDVPGDFILQDKDVLQVAFVGLSLQMLVAPSDLG